MEEADVLIASLWPGQLRKPTLTATQHRAGIFLDNTHECTPNHKGPIFKLFKVTTSSTDMFKTLSVLYWAAISSVFCSFNLLRLANRTRCMSIMSACHVFLLAICPVVLNKLIRFDNIPELKNKNWI